MCGFPRAAAGAGHLHIDGIIAAPCVDDAIVPLGISVTVHTFALLKFQPGQVKPLFDAFRQVYRFFLCLVMVLKFAQANRKTEVVNKDSCCTVRACFFVFTLLHFCTSQK